ncbi:hypothetical protein IKF12_03215 [Candidatus Saccharibacteria bacterium]|nr:hypothetical protein [Candidatus Saccharibacteria bacterium]
MEKIDKIYLDIDGVIKGVASPREDVVALLRYCLDNCPGRVYWLTTHCRGGENHTDSALRGVFDDEFVDELYSKVLPTDWGALKTEAIDMDSDFVWFDDNLFESEKMVLERNYVLDGFFLMNPRDPEMAKKAVLFLKSIEERGR